MKTFSIAVFLILVSSQIIVSQTTITGVVLYNDDKEPFEGVNIIEEGTNNVVLSDSTGKFSIDCDQTSPVLRISYVGFKIQKIVCKPNDFIEVKMEDSDLIVCYEPNIEPSIIGINIGVKHFSYGIDFRNILPYRYNYYQIRVNGKWRFSKESNYLYVHLQKRLFWEKFLITNLNLAYQKNQNPMIKNQYVSVFPTLEYRSYALGIGYALQLEDFKNEKNKHGLKLSLAKRFRSYITLYSSYILWKNNTQYRINLTGKIPKTMIFLSTGWEKMKNWQQYNISLMYWFSY